jgi:hypothetical protein
LVRGLPPVFVGAVHERVACPLPEVAVRPVGALGTVAGVAERMFDGVEVPTPF